MNGPGKQGGRDIRQKEFYEGLCILTTMCQKHNQIHIGPSDWFNCRWSHHTGYIDKLKNNRALRSVDLQENLLSMEGNVWCSLVKPINC